MIFQGQSSITPIKQYDFGNFLDYWFRLVGNIRRKGFYTSPVIYIDTNAGSGYNDSCNVFGSPIIFCQKAKEYNIPYEAHLVEIDKESADKLTKRTERYNAKVYNDDNLAVVPSILNGVTQNRLGLIYSDANGIPNWSMISIASNHPYSTKFDILIRYPAAATKRNRHNGCHLKNEIKNIHKKYLYVKEPIDKFQWAFILGMNYPYSDWKREKWYSTNNKEGQRILDKLMYTKNELRERMQLSLFPEEK